jgi:chemotaxis protein MotB
MNTKPAIYIIKKKGGHGGQHGGAWKVAYADFVTAMMALFIVLWLLSTASKATKEAIAGYFRDPSGTKDKVGGSIVGSGEKILISRDNMSQLKQKLEKAIKALPNFEKVKKHIVMTITSEGLRIELTESENGTFFDSGSPNLSDDGREIVKTLGEQLGELPNKLAIEGHTDSSPFADGRNYGNWELSSDRANSTRRLMQQNGIRADQITQVRGFADQRLLKPEAPLDPGNRRISLIVLYQDDTKDAGSAGGATDSTPGGDDKSAATDAGGAPALTGKDADRDARGSKDVAAPPPPPPQIGPPELGAESKPSAKKNSGSAPGASDTDKKASSAMTMEEIRRAVEKMNGKTAPAATPARGPSDKEKKDKPQ